MKAVQELRLCHFAALELDFTPASGFLKSTVLGLACSHAECVDLEHGIHVFHVHLVGDLSICRNKRTRANLQAFQEVPEWGGY